ncbi:hypothetical protein [Kitasatospora aureofaciens]|uniref:hypothetical protein n=1 Tax=Kitasatospora aureofaciens TaxID=1894 RepID=UPI001C49113A|nr:hypothetical protein [Kitasatospora aureofaciens]MBV6699568.1 hypothetical protein [Kitasatospora aureofaciens]
MNAPRSEYGPVVLANELELTYRLFERAKHLGLVPPPDVEERRWSRAVVEPLVERREEIGAALAADAAERAAKLAQDTAREREAYGLEVLRRRLGLVRRQFDEARDRGLIPEPDTEGRAWSAALEAELRARAAEIIAALGAVPRVGAGKAALVIGHATGLPVTAEDVRRLAEAGILQASGEFRGHPTYSRESLAAMPDAAVEEVVTDRLRRGEAEAEAAAEALRQRLAESLSAEEAAEELGWSARRLQAVTEKGGLTRGVDGRYARAEVMAVAAADPWR